MSLQGGGELKARLRAIKDTFKTYGRQWGDEDVVLMRTTVHSGEQLRKSFRVKSVTTRRVSVVAKWTWPFYFSGTKAHDEVPRTTLKGVRGGKGGGTRPVFGPVQVKGALVFKGRNGIVFAKRVRHPRTRAHSGRRWAAEEALRRHPLVQAVIRQWNEAGKRGTLKA